MFLSFLDGKLWLDTVKATPRWATSRKRTAAPEETLGCKFKTKSETPAKLIKKMKQSYKPKRNKTNRCLICLAQGSKHKKAAYLTVTSLKTSAKLFRLRSVRGWLAAEPLSFEVAF